MSLKKFSMRVTAYDDDYYDDTPMGQEDDLADYNQNEADDYLHEGEREDVSVEESLYVNVYEVHDNYGGPEEGGWYYDSGEVIKSYPVANQEEAEAVRTKLQQKYSIEQKDRKPFGSVQLNNPDEKMSPDWEPTSQADDESQVHYEGKVVVWIEDHPAKDFPDERPHYE